MLFFYILKDIRLRCKIYIFNNLAMIAEEVLLDNFIIKPVSSNRIYD